MLPPRIEDKIEVADCWYWTASVDQKGYGHVRWKGKLHRAHRIVWELLVGPIPEGMQIDHLCQVKCCVNPDHLEVVTNLENARRRNYHTKAFCPQGHPYIKGNLLKRKDNRWRCKTCARDYQRRKKHVAN